MKNKNFKWAVVAGVAAFVAVVTTIAVLVLRARSKKKAWYDEKAALDFDEEDFAEFDLEKSEESTVNEE